MKQWGLIIVFLGLFNPSYAMLPAIGAGAAAAAPFVASAVAGVGVSEVFRVVREHGADPMNGPITLRHHAESERTITGIATVLERHTEWIAGLQGAEEENDNFKKLAMTHYDASSRREEEILTLVRRIANCRLKAEEERGDTSGERPFLEVIDADKNTFFCFEDEMKKRKQDEVLAVFSMAGQLYHETHDQRDRERAKVAGHLCVMVSRLIQNDDMQQSDKVLSTCRALLGLVNKSTPDCVTSNPSPSSSSSSSSFVKSDSRVNLRLSGQRSVSSLGISTRKRAVDYNTLARRQEFKQLTARYGTATVVQALTELRMSEDIVIEDVVVVSRKARELHDQVMARKRGVAQIWSRSGKQKKE